MRTPEQIKARIAEVKENDWLGTQVGDLVGMLPYEHAKPYLRDEITEEEWDETLRKADPLKSIKNYLPFAWDKANNCRGISAGRSLEHIKTWLWLAGYNSETISNFFDDYSYYGKEQLVIASILVDFDWHEQDNGQWVNREDAPGLQKETIDMLIRMAEVKAARLNEIKDK